MALSSCWLLHFGKMAALSPASALHSRTDEEEGQEQKAVSYGLILQRRLGNGLSFGHIADLNKISPVKKSRENRHWWTCSVVCHGHFAEKGLKTGLKTVSNVHLGIVFGSYLFSLIATLLNLKITNRMQIFKFYSGNYLKVFNLGLTTRSF